MSLKIALLVLVGMLNIGVGLTVLSRNVRKSLNIAFFLVALGVAIWVEGIAAFLLAGNAHNALTWARVYYFGPLLIVAASVVFAHVFPSGGKIATAKSYIGVLPAVALAVLLLLVPNFLFTELLWRDWGKEIVLNRSQYLVYSVYLISAFLITIQLIYRKTKTEKGAYRSQAKVFFQGYLVSCIVGVFFNLVLPWFGNYQLIWIGPLASSIYVFATAYGIVRHKLFDIRSVVARTVGYSISLFAIASLYGFVVFGLLQVLTQEVFSLRTQMLLSAATAITGLFFPFLKKFFDRQTNRLFYRDAYDPQEFLGKINKTVINSVEIDILLPQAVAIIETYLKPQFCAIDLHRTAYVGRRVVGSEHNRGKAVHDLGKAQDMMRELHMSMAVTDDLAENDMKLYGILRDQDVAVLSELSTASAHNSNVLGYLVLGPKKSGNPYNLQDLEMIRIVSGELAIATQNALRFEEIEKFNVTLQEKVNEATRRLRRTNDKLKVMDETKDDFISMASHQLRTPLTSIKGYVSMVLDGDMGEVNQAQRKALNQALISSQRMVFLIADLLNLSRLKTGRFVIEATPTRLADIIESEVNQLQETAKARELELVYTKPAHFPTLMLDETKIRQVAMNFMDNAIYYTHAGGRIVVELKETEKMVEFTVTDNGIGVPKAEQPHLFTKFYRAGNARKARPDGTGLGLFMAKKVIVAQGGSIIFHSKEGKGSTFGFMFAKAKLSALPRVNPLLHGSSPLESAEKSFTN